ncbi:beta strand repeat-containing protein [Ereboglobus luteus]|uniref:Autotransporter domain-containing protein n=1 Tax=Ereboglobus luteus TaxID=1796921 RepID=A0A2U8E3S8_9BACT|nr:autotransporter-associated beta strand repeat-containing protein [Ereboglobus luteus]AWI09456.1 hypothetical protein CKA38_09545 [Ereboglobus luteus]
MQSPKNEFPTAKLFFSWLSLMLLAGGGLTGQTVVEVERNRFEGSRFLISGTYAINVHNGVTYTYQNSSWFGDTNGGGALFVNGGVFTLGPVDGGTGRTVFTGNMARRGGAITITGGAIASLTNVRFGTLSNASSGNRTIGDHGGAIDLVANNSTLILRNAEFYRNVSERGVSPGSAATGGGFGGAIYIPNSGILEVHDSTFGSLAQADPMDFFSTGWTPAVNAAAGTDRGTGNWAIDGRGGAIASQGNVAARISIYNTQFYHNTAARGALNANGDGGAIALSAGTQQATIEDSLFYGNRSRGGLGGGAIYADNPNIVVRLKDTVFTNNIATGNGGAIYLSGGTVNITATKDITYEGNYAATGATNATPSGSKGGFIYMSGAAITNIDIATGATLTIGGSANSAHDTLASSNTNVVINVNSGGDTGTLILHGASTDYSGALNVHAGSVLLGGTAARFTGTSQITVKAGAIFGGVGIANNVSVESGGVFQVGPSGADNMGSGVLGVSGTLKLSGGSMITGRGSLGTALDGVNVVVLGSAAGDWVTADVQANSTLAITGTYTSSLTGAGGVVKTGAGELHMGRTGGYTGGTRLEEGLLSISTDTALGTGAVSITGTDTGLYFRVGMDFANALDISGGVTLTAAVGDVSMQGAITGAGTLIKTGVRELMLGTNASAFTGSVIINQGILSGDINAASAVRLENFATYAGNLVRSSGQLLAGYGSINGNLTLSGGKLSFDFRNWVSGGSLAPDQIHVTGNISSTGNNLINLDNIGAQSAYALLVGAIFRGSISQTFRWPPSTARR